MKKLIIIGLLGLSAASCRSFNEIGQVEIITTKNIPGNPNVYETIATPKYKEREIRKKRMKSIDMAIDKELSLYPGATHLVNARIYAVEGFFRYQYAVVGEVVKAK